MIVFSTLQRVAQRLTPLAATALRLALGLVFLRHGLTKLHMGVGGVAGFLGGLGFPVPQAWAVVLIVIETFGAACVIAGLLTRFWAACFAVEMVVAIARAILPTGRSFELEGVLLAGALALVCLGDGWIALGQLVSKKSKE